MPLLSATLNRMGFAMLATRVIRNSVLFAAALCLSLSFGLSNARALTECPGQSNGVPGPFYVLFAVGSDKIDADGMAKIKQAAKLAKDLYLRMVCVRRLQLHSVGQARQCRRCSPDQGRRRRLRGQGRGQGRGLW